jgi:hypothetical protein
MKTEYAFSDRFFVTLVCELNLFRKAIKRPAINPVPTKASQVEYAADCQ